MTWMNIGMAAWSAGLVTSLLLLFGTLFGAVRDRDAVGVLIPIGLLLCAWCPLFALLLIFIL